MSLSKTPLVGVLLAFHLAEKAVPESPFGTGHTLPIDGITASLADTMPRNQNLVGLVADMIGGVIDTLLPVVDGTNRTLDADSIDEVEPVFAAAHETIPVGVGSTVLPIGNALVVIDSWVSSLWTVVDLRTLVAIPSPSQRTLSTDSMSDLVEALVANTGDSVEVGVALAGGNHDLHLDADIEFHDVARVADALESVPVGVDWAIRLVLAVSIDPNVVVQAFAFLSERVENLIHFASDHWRWRHADVGVVPCPV